jgi:hypothetical protein
MYQLTATWCTSSQINYPVTRLFTVTMATNGAITTGRRNQEVPHFPGPEAISAHLSPTAVQTKPRSAALTSTQSNQRTPVANSQYKPNQQVPHFPAPKPTHPHLSLTAVQTKPIVTLRGAQRLCNTDGAHFTNGY